jgi:NSS family neurotransmitter:Na+ symporter
MQILDFFDFASNSLLMPVVALFTCIFVGYFIKPKAIIDEVEVVGNFKMKKMFTVIIKYVAPICIVLILAFSVLSAFGIVNV